MKKTWVNSEGNTKCILFFNGWGMDGNAVKHMGYSGYDICMFNEYGTIEFSDNDFINYKKLWLVAWSMGVWGASTALHDSRLKFAGKIAINGTEKPVDCENGIPENVFRRTIDNWNDRNRTKFNMRMSGGRENYMKCRGQMSKRDSAGQKNELRAIWELATGGTVELGWSNALVGEKDKVFVAENQKNWWRGRAEMVILDMPHFLFTGIKTWDEIIQLCLK